MITTGNRYQASVHLTLHLQVESESPDAVSDAVRDLVASRPGIRATDISGVVVRPMGMAELLSTSNLELWQEQEAVRTGTTEQQQQYAAGCLTEDELCRLARASLFAGLGEFTLRRRLGAAAIPHPRNMGSSLWRCVDPTLPIPISWATLPTPELSSAEWRRLDLLNRAVNNINCHPWLVHARDGATVATRIHKGTCLRCHREAAQVSALVTIAWAGRTLSREYLL